VGYTELLDDFDSVLAMFCTEGWATPPHGDHNMAPIMAMWLDDLDGPECELTCTLVACSFVAGEESYFGFSQYNFAIPLCDRRIILFNTGIITMSD
jgi:hypothetical protein